MYISLDNAHPCGSFIAEDVKTFEKKVYIVKDKTNKRNML